MTERVHIGLGSNLGDRERYLLLAAQALSRVDAVSVLRHSAVYETEAVGPIQPNYLNAVVETDCGLAPARLLTILKQIEVDLGRTPGTPWGPRIIDLDILLWGERIVAEPSLNIPHPELHRRRFALQPLSELVPDAVHPALHKTILQLLERAPRQELSRHVGSLWPEARP
jgi:2-amino-4-hydroxy-6-hydroxymethyldihydropteridine diphosphokinase